MDNKELIKQAYKDIQPSEELVERTLAREAKSAPKRFAVRRGAAIAVGIAAACALTVSAAALGGLFDLSALFGGRIVADNEKIVGALMKNVRELTCEVNDSDYTIKVNGIAGDAECVIISAELCRVDGTSVRDYFECLKRDDWFEQSNFLAKYYSTSYDWLGGYSYTSLNENGNLDVYMEITSPDDLNGERITAEYNGVPFGDGSAEANLLGLSYSISFDYDNSGSSAVMKCCYSPEETFTYRQSFFDFPERDGEGNINADNIEYIDFDSVSRLVSAEFGMTGGKITLEWELDEQYEKYDREHHVSQRFNDIFLICADGTRVPVTVTYYMHSIGNVNKLTLTAQYGDDLARKQIVDIENVTAFSINGTVYELS